MNPVVQEDDYGCGVACVANILNIPYKEALLLFGPLAESKAKTEGFYLEDICTAMQLAGWDSYWLTEQVSKQIPHRNRLYNIVFLKAGDIYPAGHYLVRERRGWYNSWINFPEYPRKAGIQKELIGEPEYYIFNRKL